MHTYKHIYTHTVYTYMCAHTYIHIYIEDQANAI